MFISIDYEHYSRRCEVRDGHNYTFKTRSWQKKQEEKGGKNLVIPEKFRL